MITDKMVQRASKIFYETENSPLNLVRFRAILEDAAPRIAAQALREAAKGVCTPYYIEQRAQELDPK